jgi:hypothetical protein
LIIFFPVYKRGRIIDIYIFGVFGQLENIVTQRIYSIQPVISRFE